MAGPGTIIPPPIQGGLGPNSAPQGKPYGVDYRQLQRPAQPLAPWTLRSDSEGIGSEAAALGSAFREFGDITSSMLDKTEAQRGRAAGAAAGAAGKGAPKTGLASITAYGESYNAAVHASYEIHSKLALEKQLSSIEADTIGNPDGFQKAAGAALRATLQAADPSYRPELQQFGELRIQAGLNRQRNQAINDQRNKALADYEQATPDLITGALHTAASLPPKQGDAVVAKLISEDQDRLNALVASHVITPEQAVELHARMVKATDSQLTGQKIDISLQPILQTMRSNLEAADKLIVKPDPHLTPEENAVRLHTYEDDREAYIKAQTAAHVQDLAAVHQQLAGGAFGQQVEQHLQSLYQAGALSQEGLYAGLAESLRNQKKRIGDEADAQLVDAIMHGEHPGPLDPNNKAESKAVDLYFREHVAQSGEVTPDQYATGAAEVVRQTGIVPASVASHIRIGLISGDPVRTAQAAALAARIEGVNPRIDVYNGSRRLAAFASTINDNLRAGMSPVEAYNLAVRIKDIPPEQRKIREAAYTQAIKAQGPNGPALQRQLDSETPGIFAHSPPAPVPMQAEFDNLTREYYDQTGNLGQARQLAGAQLRKTWGVTTVNGSPQLMKWPVPDSLVPTIRADIASSVKAAGYDGDPSNVHLVSDAYTDSSNGRVWGLAYTDPKTGLTDVMLDKHNQPLVYHLPAGPDFAKARQELIDQKLAHARALRAAQRENSSEQIMFENQLADEMLHGNPAQRQMAGR